MVRTELAADASLADILARNKFGMAMAAMIRIIATTISSSIRVKPFCFRIKRSFSTRDNSGVRYSDPLLAERAASANLQIFCYAVRSLEETLRRLLLELANSYFKADHAVVIAQRE